MRRGWVSAILAAALAMAASLGLWWAVEQDRRDKVARIAEAVSWGSRSELVQRMETKLRALRQLADFWARYGRLPHDQWVTDVQIELSHFHGMRVIAWSDPEHGVRYYTSAPEPVFHRQPSEPEWEALGAALAVAHRQETPVLVGPTEGEDGHAWYHVYVPVRRDGEARGVLIAVVDAAETLAELLHDEAPGYAVTVSWDGVPLYQRDEPAPGAPDSWTREGWIQLSLGPRWKVTHRPTRQLLADLSSPAVSSVPVLGSFISVLIGALVLANARARSGARAARDAEAEVRRLNADLEGRVAARTAELEALVADLELFNQSVSHDLRSPLSTILIQADLLHEEASAQQAAESALAAERIVRAGRRMTETLDHLMLFSRASRSALATERVDMGRLAAEAFQEVRGKEVGGAQVEWLVGELPPAEADPVLVTVLLTNLIGNALKFSCERPSCRIEVGFEPGRQGGAYFVRDDGPGFDAAAADRIFRPFQRGTNSRSVAGSGLGLAIAERIVRRHGGRIWAESPPEGGAVFFFTLPLAGRAASPPSAIGL